MNNSRTWCWRGTACPNGMGWGGIGMRWDAMLCCSPVLANELFPAGPPQSVPPVGSPSPRSVPLAPASPGAGSSAAGSSRRGERPARGGGGGGRDSGPPPPRGRARPGPPAATGGAAGGGRGGLGAMKGAAPAPAPEPLPRRAAPHRRPPRSRCPHHGKGRGGEPGPRPLPGAGLGSRRGAGARRRCHPRGRGQSGPGNRPWTRGPYAGAGGAAAPSRGSRAALGEGDDDSRGAIAFDGARSIAPPSPPPRPAGSPGTSGGFAGTAGRDGTGPRAQWGFVRPRARPRAPAGLCGAIVRPGRALNGAILLRAGRRTMGPGVGGCVCSIIVLLFAPLKSGLSPGEHQQLPSAK